MDSGSLAMRWGFIANPFREPVAERELNRDSFFVPPPYFNEIRGDLGRPSSTFIFGHRGDGKSTLRLAVQKAFEIAERQYILIDYTTFTQFNAESAKAATIDTHLESVFRAVVDALLKKASGNERILDGLSSDQLSELRWFALRYAPGGDWRKAEKRLIAVLSKNRHPRDLKRIGLRGFRHFVSFLRQKREALERGAAAGQKGTVFELVSLVLTLVAPDLPGTSELASHGSEALLHELVAIVRQSGFAGIVVLVDRLDEAPSFALDPRAATDFIRPFATALTVLEADGLSVKFFLPWEIYERLQLEIRTDRLHPQIIEWQDTTLKHLLNKRLLAFSGGQVGTLDDRVDAAIRGTFYDAIFHFAAGNPRNMLRLLDSILTELAETEENPEAISQRAARMGIEKFVDVRTKESDGDAYLERLRQHGTPPAWTEPTL